MMSKLRLVLVLAFLAVVASGCGDIYSGGKSVSCSGIKVEKDDLSNVKIGKTTKAELISLLGAPNSSWQSEDKTTEKLTYYHTKTVNSRSSFLFLWSVNDCKTEKEKMAFVLKDGVVESFRKE